MKDICQSALLNACLGLHHNCKRLSYDEIRIDVGLKEICDKVLLLEAVVFSVASKLLCLFVPLAHLVLVSNYQDLVNGGLVDVVLQG